MFGMRNEEPQALLGLFTKFKWREREKKAKYSQYFRNEGNEIVKWKQKEKNKIGIEIFEIKINRKSKRFEQMWREKKDKKYACISFYGTEIIHRIKMSRFETVLPHFQLSSLHSRVQSCYFVWQFIMPNFRCTNFHSDKKGKYSVILSNSILLVKWKFPLFWTMVTINFDCFFSSNESSNIFFSLEFVFQCDRNNGN